MKIKFLSIILLGAGVIGGSVVSVYSKNVGVAVGASEMANYDTDINQLTFNTEEEKQHYLNMVAYRKKLSEWTNQYKKALSDSKKPGYATTPQVQGLNFTDEVNAIVKIYKNGELLSHNPDSKGADPFSGSKANLGDQLKNLLAIPYPTYFDRYSFSWAIPSVAVITRNDYTSYPGLGVKKTNPVRARKLLADGLKQRLVVKNDASLPPNNILVLGDIDGLSEEDRQILDFQIEGKTHADISPEGRRLILEAVYNQIYKKTKELYGDKLDEAITLFDQAATFRDLLAIRRKLEPNYTPTTLNGVELGDDDRQYVKESGSLPYLKQLQLIRQLQNGTAGSQLLYSGGYNGVGIFSSRMVLVAGDHARVEWSNLKASTYKGKLLKKVIAHITVPTDFRRPNTPILGAATINTNPAFGFDAGGVEVSLEFIGEDGLPVNFTEDAPALFYISSLSDGMRHNKTFPVTIRAYAEANGLGGDDKNPGDVYWDGLMHFVHQAYKVNVTDDAIDSHPGYMNLTYDHYGANKKQGALDLSKDPNPFTSNGQPVYALQNPFSVVHESRDNYNVVMDEVTLDQVKQRRSQDVSVLAPRSVTIGGVPVSNPNQITLRPNQSVSTIYSLDGNFAIGGQQIDRIEAITQNVSDNPVVVKASHRGFGAHETSNSVQHLSYRYRFYLSGAEVTLKEQPPSDSMLQLQSVPKLNGDYHIFSGSVMDAGGDESIQFIGNVEYVPINDTGVMPIMNGDRLELRVMKDMEGYSDNPNAPTFHRYGGVVKVKDGSHITYRTFSTAAMDIRFPLDDAAIREGGGWQSFYSFSTGVVPVAPDPVDDLVIETPTKGSVVVKYVDINGSVLKEEKRPVVDEVVKTKVTRTNAQGTTTNVALSDYVYDVRNERLNEIKKDGVTYTYVRHEGAPESEKLQEGVTTVVYVYAPNEPPKAEIPARQLPKTGGKINPLSAVVSAIILIVGVVVGIFMRKSFKDDK